MDLSLFNHPLAFAAKAGARVMLQAALEEELFEVLGRDRYERCKIVKKAKGMAIRQGRSSLAVEI